MTDHTPSLYLDRMRRFTSISAHTADLAHHTGITLQVVPKMKYALTLSLDNEEKELHRTNNRTWEPVHPLYAPCFFDICTCSRLYICSDVSPTSQIRVEIQVKSGPLQWGKKEQGSKEIDCEYLFNDYWNTTANEFPVQGKSESPTVLTSLTEKAQRILSLGNIVALWNYNSPQKSPFVCQFLTGGFF